jgi:hypothetical protein
MFYTYLVIIVYNWVKGNTTIDPSYIGVGIPTTPHSTYQDFLC